MPSSKQSTRGKIIKLFSNEKIKVLRGCLLFYRNKNKLSWLRVAEEILSFHEYSFEGDDSLEENDKKDKLWPLKNEDLRRFVVGNKDPETGETDRTTPEQYKLEMIESFLIGKKFISQEALDRPNTTINGAYSLVEFFSPISDNHNWEMLENDFNCWIRVGRANIEERIIRLSLAENNSFYYVEELRSKYAKYFWSKEMPEPKVDDVYHDGTQHYQGWGTIAGNDGIIIFLKTNPKLKQKDTQVYLLEEVDTSLEDKPLTIRFQPYKRSLIPLMGTENLASDLLGGFEKFSFVKCLEGKLDENRKKVREYKGESTDSRQAKKIDLFNRGKRYVYGNLAKKLPGKEEGDAEKISTQKLYVVKGGAAGDKFAHNGSMENENVENVKLGKKFLKAVFDCNKEEVQLMINSGMDVNFQDPDTGTTALHIAAAQESRPILDMLVSCEGLNYLVRNEDCKFPSQLAFEIADNPSIGEFLNIKEVEQAEKEGKDIRAMLMGEDLNSEENAPSP